MKELVLSVLLLAGLTSCSKKDPDPTPVPPPAPVFVGMSWTVDGVDEIATSTQADVIPTNPIYTGFASESLSIQGSIGAGLTVMGFSNVPKAVGTYTLNKIATSNPGYPELSGLYLAGVHGYTPIGTITITSLSAKAVAGTFAFTGEGYASAKVAITNGKFNIAF